MKGTFLPRHTTYHEIFNLCFVMIQTHLGYNIIEFGLDSAKISEEPQSKKFGLSEIPLFILKSSFYDICVNHKRISPDFLLKATRDQQSLTLHCAVGLLGLKHTA